MKSTPSAEPLVNAGGGSAGGSGSGASLSTIVNSAVKTYGAAIICLLLVCCAVLGSLSWNAFGAPSSCDDISRGTATSAAADLEWELARAEETYRSHLAAREERVKKLVRSHYGNVDQRFEESLLFPVYPCVDPFRVGPWGEGGKWICRGHRRYPYERPPVVVSVGSFGMTGFEDGIWTLFGARTSTFDPFLTPKQDAVVRRKADHIDFRPWGLTGKALKGKPLGCDKPPADKTKKWVHLDQLLWAANATYVDIFKIDCECCEYGFVEDLAASFPRDKQPLGQIQMEIHWAKGGEGARAAAKLIRRLESLGYRLFHTEANPYCPTCYEIAFIHESLVKVE